MLQDPGRAGVLEEQAAVGLLGQLDLAAALRRPTSGDGWRGGWRTMCARTATAR
ncbi:MAG: hypothetical protein U1E17_06320 [Geminicoccaceae bacterium]